MSSLLFLLLYLAVPVTLSVLVFYVPVWIGIKLKLWR